MTAQEYVMGVDFGTESVRVGIFTLEGQPVVFASEPYPLSHPRSGWAEQDPGDWWAAVVKATNSAMQRSGLPKEAVVGIGADCTSCTVVAMDADFRPLRPAILWMDVRAADQAHRIAACEHAALKYNGFGNVSAEWFPCKTLWLKEHEPQTYTQAAHIGECIDWLTQRLTGEWVGSIDTASIRAYYDRNVGGWQEDFFATIGLADLLPKLPQRVLDMGEVAGRLMPDVAAELGLPPGIPVAEGGADAFVAMLGLNVLAPGKMAFITGSSHLLLGQSAHAFHGKGIFGTYTDAVVPGQYTVEGGQVSTGSIVKWLRDNFCAKEAQLAAERGIDTYTLLNELAGQVPPGSEGLIVLDYFQGNRTPYVDPEARGAIFGLSLRHGAGHLFRAVIEGIAYGTEHILQALRGHGYSVQEVVACGGPTKSPLWMQIHADVSNIPISLTAVPDAPALGSAILGAVGAGCYPDVQTAAERMVKVVGCVTPNTAAHAEYKFYVDKYINTYPRVQDLIHEIVRHEAGR
jgi:FGGY-family pentulose kinase